MNENDKRLDQGVATAPQRVECEPKHTPGPWNVIICGERGTFHITEAQRHEALKAADAALENAYGEIGPEKPSTLVIEDMRKVKVAIAKAEGRQ